MSDEYGPGEYDAGEYDQVDGQEDASDDITGELLEQAEGLDDDDLTDRPGVDPGDDVYDPPDEWREADRFGTTLEEAVEGESLDEKLSAEVPDVEADFQ